MKPEARVPKITLLPGIFLIALSAGIFTTRVLTGQGQPLNVQLTSQAWDAYNKGDFERAISKANECIDEFRGGADREETQLQNGHVPLPPKGAVSEQDKRTIMARGLLNDVATCYYIKGRSAEKLGRTQEAKEAYQAAAKYTYARTWDTNGFFWVPSEGALDRLNSLK